MVTLREFVQALRRQSGVEAAVVVGRDGLLIDSAADTAVHADGLAARVPALVAAAVATGAPVGRGGLSMAVLEYERGSAIVSQMSPDVWLLVLVHPQGPLATLLQDLRRYRHQITALA
ncbi:MAG: roadblock/LC7 domain-containing protein [Gemmatimonadaceae bacterium]